MVFHCNALQLKINLYVTSIKFVLLLGHETSFPFLSMTSDIYISKASSKVILDFCLPTSAAQCSNLFKMIFLYTVYVQIN